MKNPAIQSALAQIGLSSKEIDVYLHLLELGEGTVQEIANIANLERTGIYDIARSLKQLGLITEAFYKHRHVFIAESPQAILKRLDAQRQQIVEILPGLESFYNRSGEKPKIRYYEGSEGIKIVLEATLHAKSNLLRSILSVHDLFDILGEEYMESYVQKRIKAGIFLRVIRSKPKEVGERWFSDAKALRELRYAPANMVFSMTQYIFDQTVILISSAHEGYGISIESPDFSESQGHLFEALWQSAE